MNELMQWTTTHGDTVEVYKSEATDPRGDHLVDADAPPQFRYRVRARNQQIVEQGSEGYTRRHRAVKAAERHHPRVTS